MKRFRVILRIIWGFVIVCLLTLGICVVKLSRSMEESDHSSMAFSVNGLVIADKAESGESRPAAAAGNEERSSEDEAEPIGEVEEEQAVTAEYEEELPRIVCWGDSLTESSDEKTAYPDVLRNLSQTEVINYGIRSDTTFQVALREGAVGIYAKECRIPAETVPVRVRLYTENGNNVSLLRYGDSGVNPCSLGGIRGRLKASGDGTYFFTRSEEGEEVYIEEGSRLTTAGMADRNKDDILVIFTGTNDRPDKNSIAGVISLQRRMLEYSGCEKYIIVGMTCKEVMPQIEAVNEALSREYQNNFLDIRKYMLQYGLEAEGLRATEGDRRDIENGEIPESLRIDYVHGNKYFYDFLARLLYEKMQSMGYLPG